MEKNKEFKGIVCEVCGTNNHKKNKNCVGCDTVLPVKAAKEKVVKVEKSDQEIVEQYAHEIIRRQHTRGHVKGHQATNKDLWLDGDFFFSVVFQSADQKYQFLKAFCEKMKVDLESSADDQIQILNGIKLAKSLGIELKLEKSLDYPLPDLDLKKQVLDN